MDYRPWNCWEFLIIIERFFRAIVLIEARVLMTTKFQAIEYIFIGRPDLQVLLKPYPFHLYIFAFENGFNVNKLNLHSF